MVSVGKERVTHTVDPEVADYLTSTDNASALVNRLVAEYRSGGGSETVIIDYRIEELSSDITALEAQLQRKRERLSELRDRKSRIKQTNQRDLAEAVERVATLSSDQLQPDHPAIVTQARKVDMPPEDFLEHVESHTEDGNTQPMEQ